MIGKLLVALLGIILLTTAITPVFAQQDFCDIDGAGNTEFCDPTNRPGGDETNNSIVGPDGVVTKVTQLVIIVVGVASVIMVIVGGFLYITSGGDPGRTQKAQSMITYALVGVAIAALSQTIVIFVISRL